MNRKLLALAIGAVTALPVAATAAPTLYGKLDVSTEYLDGDRGAAEVNDFSLETNASRIGIRGEEKLDGALSVIYQLEYGVTVDGDSANHDSTAIDLGLRDRFLGLKHASLGTLQLGHMDTPLRDAEGNVDVFNDTRLDMANVLAGQVRSSNSIAYASPKIADAITARVTLVTDEDATGGGVSASLAYETDGLYLAVAHDNDIDGAPDTGVLTGVGSAYLNSPSAPPGLTSLELDTTRLVAGVDVGGLKLGALFQQAEEEASDAEQTGWLVSVAYPMDKWTFKGQVASSEGEVGPVDLGEITQIAVGADYQWTQTFKTYGLLGQYEFDDQAAADTDLTLVGVGMALSF